jgi:hypothetical protein
MRGAELLLYLC